MVTTASSSAAAAQGSENDKRRKYTIERAKANHLSRQLQMRLQYARLKVEHGWQKQNLNEVENLYFHHSHLRGPKPFPSPSLLATTQSEPVSFSVPPSNSVQSSLSFKLPPSSLSRNSVDAGTTDINDEGAVASSSTTTGSATNVSQPRSPSELQDLAIDPSLYRQGIGSLISIDVDQEGKASGSNSSGESSTSGGPEGSTPRQPTYGAGSEANPSSILSTNAHDAAYSSNHYPIVKPARPQPTRAKSNPRVVPTLTAQDLHGFSGSSLTYDSFWSSHSGQTTSRSFRGSTGNAAELPIEGPGAFGSNADAGYSVNYPSVNPHLSPPATRSDGQGNADPVPSSKRGVAEGGQG